MKLGPIPADGIPFFLFEGRIHVEPGIGTHFELIEALAGVSFDDPGAVDSLTTLLREHAPRAGRFRLRAGRVDFSLSGPQRALFEDAGFADAESDAAVVAACRRSLEALLLR